MANEYLKAPFPYFGGKSMIADKVWAALGDCKHYIEPFFGSGAVLLKRPSEHFASSTKRYETVNDKDGFVANVWRALKFAPDAVAEWADWPNNHADLSARKKALIKNEDRLLENLTNDPEWYDAKMAGYWVWAASSWIGSGLTSGDARPNCNRKEGVHSAGKTSIGQIPRLKEPITIQAVKTSEIYEWFAVLSQRLRHVNVVCGDWMRVCGGNWQVASGTAGMFFDPPYGIEDRASVYHKDDFGVAADVKKWCLERGASKDYRIVIAGYEEYQDLIDEHGWRGESWSASGGYGNQGKDSRGQTNRHREMLYYSPHCLGAELPLFADQQTKE